MFLLRIRKQDKISLKYYRQIGYRAELSLSVRQNDLRSSATKRKNAVRRMVQKSDNQFNLAVVLRDIPGKRLWKCLCKNRQNRAFENICNFSKVGIFNPACVYTKKAWAQIPIGSMRHDTTCRIEPTCRVVTCQAKWNLGFAASHDMRATTEQC